MTATQSLRRRRWGDLSVFVKIAVAVLLTVAVGLLVGVLGLRALGRTNHATEQMYRSNVASVRAIGEAKLTAYQTRLDVANHALTLDDAGMRKYRQAVSTDEQAFRAAVEQYRATMTAGEPAVVDSLDTLWNQYVQVVETKLIPASERNDIAGWERVRDAEVAPIYQRLGGALNTLAESEDADAARAVATAHRSYEHSRLHVVLLLAIGFVSALGVGLAVARGIVRSLNRVREVCEALAVGDLTRNAGIASGDEVGRMGRALDRATGNLRETVATIDQSAVSLASAPEEMATVAAQISESAEQASAQAQTVTHAAEEVSRSVHTVSAAGEEMGSSIQEIARNANDAARVATEAVTLADVTNSTVAKLGESSLEIGNVITSITSIAEQTNLLALNATIEAARAGEAGKGFAVVATEVKELAQETARATDDIAGRVQAIQTDVGSAVQAIQAISQVIARISDYQTTIASAVEEQTATTSETNRSVAEAADGVEEIAANINGVAGAAQITSHGVEEARQTTAELARMSEQLRGLVATFQYQTSAAQPAKIG
jgi:methyl-accepting chemotaxis protein